MEPLTGEALEARIKELEEERDRLLAETPFVRYAKYKTSHSSIKIHYNVKIGTLKRHGVENANQVHEHVQKGVATKYARYGNGHGGIDKMLKTKEAIYGNAFGNVKLAQKRKLEIYGNGCGDLDKRRRTNEARYGKSNGNTTNMVAGKIKKHGNAFGDINKMVTTKMNKYGHLFRAPSDVSKTCEERYGVPWNCMTIQCRQAGAAKSNVNIQWHNKLLDTLGIDFSYDDVHFDRFSYDLHFNNVLIEINPTFSHNSAYSYSYLRQQSSRNWLRPFDYHFNKTQLAIQHGYTCITIFEWMDDSQIIDIIRKHLAGEPVDSTDFALNPQLSDDRSTIRKHWCHLKTKEHIEDCGQDAQEMLDAGYVPVYDCGHAVQK